MTEGNTRTEAEVTAAAAKVISRRLVTVESRLQQAMADLQHAFETVQGIRELFVEDVTP